MLISNFLLFMAILIVNVNSVPSLPLNPKEQLSQKSDSAADSGEALSFISRFVQNGGLMNMVTKMLKFSDIKGQMDPIKESDNQPVSEFSIDEASSQIGDSKQWKSLLLGPRGVLTEIFNQVKDNMQNQYTEDIHKITKAQQGQQHDMSPEQLNFAKVFEMFMQKAGKGNFDEPLPELPFIGICNRLNCGDVYKAVDEFRKSEFFSNFQTAMSLIHDPKGWDIIGKVLENPELIEDFTNKNKIDTTDVKTDELKGFGTDFSSSVDGTAVQVVKNGENSPQLTSNVDYYSALDHVNPEDEDVIDVTGSIDSKTNGKIVKEKSEGIRKDGINEKAFPETSLPLILENIDDYDMHIDNQEEFVVARAAKRLKLGEPSPPGPTMNAKLKSGQRDKLRTFLQIANCDETIAHKCLNNADWNIERALDIFYQTPSFQESSSGCDSRKIDALFYNYANDKEDLKQTGIENRIGPNGMVRLLNDLHIDPSSVDALILAWKMKAETQCEFSADEFRNGCIQMRVDSIEKLRSQTANWGNEMKDTQKFKQLYQFAFNYAKSAATRFLEIDTAVAYWNLIFKERDARVPIWIEFLQHNKTRGVSRDTWNLFFDFLVQTMDTYENYDAEGAWPVMIDEFVDYAKLRKN